MVEILGAALNTMNHEDYNILVVDDVKENLLLVQRVLSDAYYNILTASDGLSALRLVKEKPVDLILLDIMMPIMSGIDVCKYLKVDPKTQSIPVIFLTANADNETLTKAYRIGGSDYIRKPFFKEELLARVASRLKLRDYEKDLELKVQQRTQEMAETQIKLMKTLGSIAEGHSKETYEHVDRVSEFSYRLAQLTGMKESEALFLKDAASLHDVGKLAIPTNILHKHGKLDAKELKVMKKHAALGGDMLRNSKLPLFKVAFIVANQHHEKYDGSGYPNGLKGNKIHIYGRIVAIADVFDALLFKRAYKKQWSVEEVLVYIKEMSGSHFDPDLIALFFKNINLFLDIYNVEIQKQKLKEELNAVKKNKIMNWLFNRR